jgi:hypothetical protein
MTKNTTVTWIVIYREDNEAPTAREFSTALIPTRSLAIQTAQSYRLAGKAILRVFWTDGSVISAKEYEAYVPPGMARSSV